MELKTYAMYDKQVATQLLIVLNGIENARDTEYAGYL